MTKERVSWAIADYERTRMSGNSPWDRWRKERDESAVSPDGLHAPFMHDGSVRSLRAVIELYNRGGVANPDLDPKIQPLNLAADDIDALLEFLEALRGEGYQDSAPKAFPDVRVKTAS